MSESYHYLSAFYDRFTDDVGYERWADYFERVFAREGVSPRLVLDLACGTGSLTSVLARRGYEMIGVDASADMLAQAANHCMDLAPRPVFLHQRMEELDLYGTVDACVCCLDSVNYVTDPAALREAFRRVALFLEPGGVFIFDVNTQRKFSRMNGECYIRDDQDVYCVWQVEFNGTLCTYDFDIFTRRKRLWERVEETHVERYYSPDALLSLLTELGFEQLHLYPELSFGTLTDSEDRVFITARKRNDNERQKTTRDCKKCPHSNDSRNQPGNG